MQEEDSLCLDHGDGFGSLQDCDNKELKVPLYNESTVHLFSNFKLLMKFHL
jgi:hypothetical protein